MNDYLLTITYDGEVNRKTDANADSGIKEVTLSAEGFSLHGKGKDSVGIPLKLDEPYTDKFGNTFDVLLVEIKPGGNGATYEEVLDFAGKLDFQITGTLGNQDYRGSDLYSD